MSATHLEAGAARFRAEEALARVWPGWTGTLTPLKPLLKPLRATPFRVSGGAEPAVIKVWGPGNAAAAARQAARQAEVARLMPQGHLRVPRVLTFDAASCALLMQDAGGPDLRRALPDMPDAAAESALSRAAAWLQAFHALSIRAHPFRPAGHAAWLRRLVADAESGHRAMPDVAEFRSQALALEATAMALRGAPSRRCASHRDLTLGNLLTGGDDTLWGIDFENDREDELLRDRVSLALDALCFAPFGHDRGRVLATLARGRTDRDPIGPADLFLQRAFCLGVWARTPRQPSRRQAALLKAALWLLAQPEPLV